MGRQFIFLASVYDLTSDEARVVFYAVDKSLNQPSIFRVQEIVNFYTKCEVIGRMFLDSFHNLFLDIRREVCYVNIVC